MVIILIHLNKTQPYDHFDNLKDFITTENDNLLRRISFNNHIIAEQHEMIKILIQRSEDSFERFRNIVHKLCQKISNNN
jgi:23S rRNA C2498 (ribose-2'-O)-methylase RlmM